ncbi:MAG: HAD family hydrolase, partial [Thermoanaerobaculia bacterium]
MSDNGHGKLVLFDIDGTLLSAGRVARESILVALERAYGWRAGQEHQDRARYDFSGKTDPQIVRELVADAVGRQRCEESLGRALDLYVEELERRLTPGTVVTKPGIPELLARLRAEPKVTLGLLTGNIERGARIKLEPPGFNATFPFGAFGSDSADRYELPE